MKISYLKGVYDTNMYVSIYWYKHNLKSRRSTFDLSHINRVFRCNM